MRRGSKPDLNHAEIRDGLRDAIGFFAVRDTKDFGGGWPDLIVGFRGVNFFMEVKSSLKKVLTPAEKKFHESWKGQIDIVYSLEDAFRVIGLQ